MKRSRAIYLPQLYQDSAESGRLILRDGSTAHISPAGPNDRQSVKDFFDRLSPESRFTRFFSVAGPDEKLLDLMCSSDKTKQVTLVVRRIVEGTLRIIAVGSYVIMGKDRAEVAMAVEDAFHGKGLGTQLLERLALLSVRNGIFHFWATTHRFNQPMIEMFRNSGFDLTETVQDGYLQFDFSTIPTKKSVSHSEMLDRIFTTTSLHPFFQPRSVAVVGASRNPKNLGTRILKALISGGFHGPVYPVNPGASVIGSVHAYPSVRDLPEKVDLAVVVVPKDHVFQVVDDCSTAGVRSLVIITAGFAEMGDEGKDLQKKLVDKVRGYGMRMVGPNCMGIINTDPEISLNAQFSPVYPPRGRIAMSTQSGALGLAILAEARDRNLGFSTFVSVGNKADVSGNDLLQYWEGDPETDVILLYLESFGNPRRFARIARRVARNKPVVAVKSGRTLAGKRAAGSHTAAMAASDVAVEALFRQTGVIRANTLEEMFDLAVALETQPLLKGNRIGIITNAGGPGILCADMCEANGLRVPELSSRTKKRLRTFLPDTASLTNPVDMIASAGPDQYSKAIQAVLGDSEIDALVVIYIPVDPEFQETPAAICRGIERARSRGGANKTVLACLMSESTGNQPLILKDEKVPTYIFPETPARILGKISAYSAWKKQPLGIVPEIQNMDPVSARDICAEALNLRGPGWLTADETRRVLRAMQLPLPPGDIATSAKEAAQIASKLGFPVAVKLASHVIVHKTEMGGVLLDLNSEEEVEKAFHDIQSRLSRMKKKNALEGVLVQPMLSQGVEVMIGMTEDPLFGPLIAFGLGGIHVEILGDVCFRVTPLTDHDAAEMIREIRGYRLLKGYRGHPAADIKALENALLRISQLVEEVPEISELDLNPIFALPPGKGCSIVDARIRVG